MDSNTNTTTSMHYDSKYAITKYRDKLIELVALTFVNLKEGKTDEEMATIREELQRSIKNEDNEMSMYAMKNYVQKYNEEESELYKSAEEAFRYNNKSAPLLYGIATHKCEDTCEHDPGFGRVRLHAMTLL